MRNLGGEEVVLILSGAALVIMAVVLVYAMSQPSCEELGGHYGGNIIVGKLIFAECVMPEVRK